MNKEELEKNNDELRLKIVSDMMKIQDENNNPYFSKDWLIENILGVNIKIEKRKAIIEKLLKK